MCKKCDNNGKQKAITGKVSVVENHSLDKLAQLGKKIFEDPIDDMPELKGSTSIKDLKTLRNRCKRTYMKNWLSIGLVQLNQARQELRQDEISRQTKRKRIITTKKFENQNYYSFDNSKKIRDIPNYSYSPTQKKTTYSPADVFSTTILLFDKALKSLNNDTEVGFLTYSWNPKPKTKNYRKKPKKQYAFKGIPLNEKKIPSFFKFKKRSPGKKIENFDSKNEDAEIIRSYQNMYHCNRELLLQSDGKIKANYCKNRLCLVCNSIRTADLINKYEPVFEAWKDDMYLVTLTAVNCTKANLVPQSVEMFNIFTKVKDVLKKRYQAGKTEPKCKYTEKSKRWKKYFRWKDYPKFEGIRKFECTATRPNDFHPHFHVIVRTKKAAEDLISQWLKITDKSNILARNKDNKTATIDGQDIKKADKGSSKELFKYFTKIISSSDKDKEKSVYLDRLDTIFRAMRKKRVFQNFGFFLKEYVKGEQAPKDLTDLEIEEKEAADELLFEFGNEDKQQEKVNEVYHSFVHHSKQDGAAVLQLQEDLYTLEVEFAANFKNSLSELDLKLQNIAYQAFSSSQKTRKDVKDLQIILATIEVQVNIYKALPYGDAITDEEIQDKIYLFNDNVGMWFNRDNGEPLFDYKISDTIKDMPKRFKLPKGYSSKIFELFIKERQNSFY